MSNGKRNSSLIDGILRIIPVLLIGALFYAYTAVILASAKISIVSVAFDAIVATLLRVQ